MAKFVGPKQQAFIKALQDKGCFKGCPYCGNSGYTVLGTVAHIWMNDDAEAFDRGPELKPYLNCGAAVCNNCGHVEFFSLDLLGLQ